MPLKVFFLTVIPGLLTSVTSSRLMILFIFPTVFFKIDGFSLNSSSLSDSLMISNFLVISDFLVTSDYFVISDFLVVSDFLVSSELV